MENLKVMDSSKPVGRRFQIIVGSLRDIKVDKNDPSVTVINRGSGYRISLFNKEVIEIIRALVEGYDVKALCRGEYCEMDHSFFPGSSVFEKRACSLGAIIETVSVPDGIGLMLGAGDNPVFNWLHNASERPRDSFLQLGEIVYLNPNHYPKKSILKKDHKGFISRLRWLMPAGLEQVIEVKKEYAKYVNQRSRGLDYKNEEEWEKYLEECRRICKREGVVERKVDEEISSVLKLSHFGESGRVVVFDEFIIASDEIKRKLKVSEGYRFQGKRVYFVKPITAYIGDKKASPKDFGFHIDYHVNGLTLNDHVFIYLDPDFYSKNRAVFRMIEREQKAEFDFVPKTEQNLIPANFLVIPDGKILIAGGAPGTQERLELRLGENNVLTTNKPLPNLLKEGYGIRCITNVICY